ncbi:MAG: YbhB/YbcL family Raf kinase inhibitor-like protein [Campylobacterales bacterium]|nr:YbhB/YbcL family Raf kinase inhibitor-like protein [Campylobacterales bacterium]
MIKFIVALLMGTTLLLAEGFSLKSNDILGQLSNEQVFNGFGCKGENISPALEWTNAPKGTQSFAITMYDKDAPTGSGWWHWVVFNIPAEVTSLAKNSGDTLANLMPKDAVQSMTSYGKSGFGGACPPLGHGPHQYVITVYALGTKKLDLDANASPALVGYMLNANTLAKASVIAYYAR